MSRRGYISWKTKYAAALRVVGGIPYEHAKAMHEEQMISLFQVNHDIQHGVVVIDEHWNLTPMLRPEHKARFAADNRAVKKVVRIERAKDEAVNRLLAKKTGEPVRERRKAILRSRGFDKTKTRTLGGKVVPRKARRS